MSEPRSQATVEPIARATVEPIAQATAEPTQSAIIERPPKPDQAPETLVEEDLLVEDVSIDGMCGVY